MVICTEETQECEICSRIDNCSLGAFAKMLKNNVEVKELTQPQTRKGE